MKHFLLLLLAALPTLLLAQTKSKPNGSVALQQEGYIMFAVDSIEILLPVEFTLTGKKPLHYRISFKDQSSFLLSQNINGRYMVQDTLLCDTNYWQWQENRPVVSSFRITDFDADGNQDFVYVSTVSGHGDMATGIYLNDPGQGRLVLLTDTDGNAEFLVNPEYDAKNKILTTSVSGGMKGHFNTTYKLKNNAAEPLEHIKVEFTDDGQTVESRYKYKNGEWVLIKTTVTP